MAASAAFVVSDPTPMDKSVCCSCCLWISIYSLTQGVFDPTGFPFSEQLHFGAAEIIGNSPRTSWNYEDVVDTKKGTFVSARRSLQTCVAAMRTCKSSSPSLIIVTGKHVQPNHVKVLKFTKGATPLYFSSFDKARYNISGVKCKCANQKHNACFADEV